MTRDNVETSGNDVLLRGRIRHEPEVRELPSGDNLVTFRLIVPRPDDEVRRGRSTDWVDCAVWSNALRHRVVRWRPDDEVEVRGSLRRRFFKFGGGDTGTRLEVEVLAGKVLRRAPAAARGDATQS